MKLIYTLNKGIGPDHNLPNICSTTVNFIINILTLVYYGKIYSPTSGVHSLSVKQIRGDYSLAFLLGLHSLS